MGERLQGRVAVITGGASGMGRATVLRFLDEGARVVVADLNEGTGKETLELVGEAGHADCVRFVRTDVAEESDVEAMIRCATDEFGRLDCVFNNAGLGGAFGDLAEIEVEDWDYTFHVLVRGPFLGIKHATRVFRDQGEGGSIISTASVAGLSGGAGPVAYSAAKAAVVNLTQAASRELAADRIRVNAICPGGILTPLIHRGAEDEARENLKTLQPWPDGGEGEDIAAAALFLASDEARFITGEALVVDGGLQAAGPDLARRTRSDGRRSPFAGRTGVDRGTTGLDPIVR
jgi:NAD(P)-dependent dehydrogenase (short-subunit alcohol dehydrogenase family)